MTGKIIYKRGVFHIYDSVNLLKVNPQIQWSIYTSSWSMTAGIVSVATWGICNDMHAWFYKSFKWYPLVHKHNYEITMLFMGKLTISMAMIICRPPSRRWPAQIQWIPQSELPRVSGFGRCVPAAKRSQNDRIQETGDRYLQKVYQI